MCSSEKLVMYNISCMLNVIISENYTKFPPNPPKTQYQLAHFLE